MDFLHCGAAHGFAGTLRVFDVQPEQGFHDDVEAAAGELPHLSLCLMEHGPFQPA